MVNLDPVEIPFFKQQFENDDEEIGDSSLIIQSEDTEEFRVIAAQDLYEWQLEEDQLYATGMVAEQRITAAISSIQGGAQTMAYFVTGHGEMDMTEQYYLSDTLESDGYKVESYNLVYNDTALTSKDCLLFLSPVSDLTDEECEIVREFLEAGGRAVFMINPRAGELVNFNKAFEDFGLELENDLIVEADSENYLNSQVMIKPQMNEENPVLASVVEADASLTLPLCRGIASTEVENVEQDPILSSSDNSYGKVNPYTETLEREEGDTDGPFLIGVTARNVETNSRLVLLGTSDFVSTLDNARYGGNIALFMDCVAWASEKPDSVVIAPKALVSAPLKIESTATSYRLMFLVILIIPVVILVCGAVVWHRRLRR